MIDMAETVGDAIFEENSKLKLSFKHIGDMEKQI
jgi:hypothetical protein